MPQTQARARDIALALDTKRQIRSRVLSAGRAAPSRFDDPTLPTHYPPDLELEPIHLFIDLYVSIPARSVGGRVTTTVVAKRAKTLTLILDAVDFDDLSVRDLDDHVVNWQYDGRKLAITWEQPFAAEESR